MQYQKKIKQYDALLELLENNAPSSNQYSHYDKMITLHKSVQENITEDSILFFGDGLTEALCLSCFFQNGVNFGISGDTTTGLLKRLPKYNNIRISKGVSISIGINDLNEIKSNDYSGMINNYKKILDAIPSDKNILLDSIHPVNYKLSAYQDEIKLRISFINKYIESLCNERKNCQYLDTNKYLADINGNLKEDYHRGDGLHLNSAGNRIWGDLINNAIKDW